MAESFIGEILAAPHRDHLDLCQVYKMPQIDNGFLLPLVHSFIAGWKTESCLIKNFSLAVINIQIIHFFMLSVIVF